MTLVQHPQNPPPRWAQRARPGLNNKGATKPQKEKDLPSFKMSVLPPEVHAALASLLQGLSSPDNQIRTHAEEQLNNEWIVARPDVLLMGLVEQIQSAQEPSVWRPYISLTTRTTRLADMASTKRLAPSLQFSFGECQQRHGKHLEPRSPKSFSCCYSRPKR